ncbi:MAG: signal peptide peptidase SppA [Bacteroidota bacterium]
MKNFFGAFFGSCLGILLTGLVITVIAIFSIKSLVDDGNSKHYVSVKNSVLKLNLNQPIAERTVENPFGKLDLGPLLPPPVIGLNTILSNIKKAKADNNIKGIYLEINSPGAGFATLEEIRNALIDFKTSGKFIYAYSETYSQKAYYIASVANKIFLNSQGTLELKGLSSQIMFFKNMLAKLGVEVQIFRHGKFKSAIEPFMLDKMSEANRSQIETYLASLWNHMLEGISESRKISVINLNKMANDLLIRNPNDALQNKLVDGLKYEDEVFDEIKKEIKIAESDKINFVSFDKYALSPNELKLSKDKIAIVYAVGEIMSGKGSDEYIGSETISKTLRDARLDTNIKAIVLRVNSPGGSALASDVIWREVLLAKTVKPIVVSMGDVAASGGYYISCAASKIFAQPNTITGSIGVFGLIPNVQKALSDKLGITIDTVNTNKHSDVGTILRGASSFESEYIQKSVEDIYDVFITRVSEGRQISKSIVDSIGQGRVWSGENALKIKLVDEIGGINDAIAAAAKLAKISNYKLIDLPIQKNPIEELLSNGTDEIETRTMKTNLGEQYIYIKQLKNVLIKKGIQARIPYEMLIE